MRCEEPLSLEALQRRIDGADRIVAPRARRDFTPNLSAVGFVAERDDDEKDDELQFSERRRSHMSEM